MKTNIIFSTKKGRESWARAVSALPAKKIHRSKRIPKKSAAVQLELPIGKGSK